MELNINSDQFIQDIKNLFQQELNTEKPGVISRGLEWAEDNKNIVLELAQGIVAKEEDKKLSADFVIQRLKELPENLIIHLRSEGTIQVANAERIAKEFSYKLIQFLNDEVLAKIKTAVDNTGSDNPE